MTSGDVSRAAIAKRDPRGVALRARYVFPVDRAPLADGIVVVDDARIVSVGRDTGHRPIVELGNVALLPAFVNAHAHLDLSDVAARLGRHGQDFADWLREVMVHRRGNRPGEVDPVRLGLLRCAESGTAVVGDIVQPDWAPNRVEDTPTRTVAFLELIGFAAASIEPNLERARHHLGRGGGTSWLPGLSPHAPYTAHPRLVAAAVQLAAADHAPVAMHLAESRAELDFMRTGEGPFRELLIEKGRWDPDAIRPGSRPLDYLKLLADAPRALVIHGNYFGDEEIGFVAARHDTMSVVYCPRTHAYFGHAPHPLPNLLARGANVALGTDSLASNPDERLLDEMRYVHRHVQSVAPRTVLELGTINGARALGLEHEAGSLAPGKRADLALVPLPDVGADDPHTLLFDSELPVTRTMLAGTFLDESV